MLAVEVKETILAGYQRHSSPDCAVRVNSMMTFPGNSTQLTQRRRRPHFDKTTMPRGRKKKTPSSTSPCADQLHNTTRNPTHNTTTQTTRREQLPTRLGETQKKKNCGRRGKDILSQQWATAKHATERQYSSTRDGPSTSKKYIIWAETHRSLHREEVQATSLLSLLPSNGIRRRKRARSVLPAPEAH